MGDKGSKTLILVVDIDDDLGRMGVKTPIVGYREVVKSLIDFGMKKPEDSDVNAIFKALSIYRELKKLGYNVEIAVLSGDESSSLKANLRIKNDLSRLKKEIGFNDIVLVSDGVSDERILPVIQSIGDVVGVERVIVEQSRGVEETFILLGRYIKKAVNELPYSKIFLGIPGVILITIALASFLKLTMYLNELVLTIIGLALVIKGFGVIGRAIGLWRKSPILFTTVFMGVVSYIATAVVVGATIYAGLTVSSFTVMIDVSQALIIFGTLSIISGRLIYKLSSGLATTIWKDVIPLIPLVFVVTILQRVSYMARTIKTDSIEEILKLFSTTEIITLIGLAVAVTIITTIVFMAIEHRLGSE